MAGQAWARIDVTYLTNPKMTAVSERAMVLHLASILWLAAHGADDGVVPPEALPHLRLTVRQRGAIDPLVSELIKGQLWHQSLDPPGYRVHDYSDYAAPARSARERSARKRARDRDEHDRHA